MRFAPCSTILLFPLSWTIVTSLDLDGLLRYRQDVPLGTAASSPAVGPTLTTPSAVEVSTVPSLSASPSATAPTIESSAAQTTASAVAVATTGGSSPLAQTTSSASNIVSQSSFVVSSTEDSSTKALSITSGHSSKTLAVVTTIISVSGSSTFRNVITTSQVVDAASASSSTPGLNGSTSGGTSTGLSDSSKKIIAGVVGGVGGAILLGGLAVVLWRIFGRRTGPDHHNNDMIDGSQAGRDKTNGASAPSPFTTNLEQHHAGPINTSSNF